MANKENSFNEPTHDTVLHHGFSPVLSRDRAAPFTVTMSEITPEGYIARWGKEGGQDNRGWRA